MEDPILQKIGFIGAGNMAKAIGQGLITSGIVKPAQLIASAPSDNCLAEWREWGVKTTNNNGDVVLFADIVFLAVKPHLLDSALEGLVDTAQVKSIDNKLYVSILAGTTLEDLHTKLTKALKKYWNDTHRIVRTMVNTPMMVGVGCSVFCCGTNANNSDQVTITKILSSRGICQMVPESLINAVGGLSGSGPAYAFLIIEALSDGAVKQGLPREMATTFAAQTMLGAAKMVLETGKHCGQLKDEVCSPGGSTIAGIHALERAGVRSALMDAVEAAVKRSAEMGKKTCKAST